MTTAVREELDPRVKIAARFLGIAAPSPTWPLEAACRDMDPDLFFPHDGGSTAEAKAACQSCPVMMACLAFALGMGERHGVWGNTTGRQRRAMFGRLDVWTRRERRMGRL